MFDTFFILNAIFLVMEIMGIIFQISSAERVALLDLLTIEIEDSGAATIDEIGGFIDALETDIGDQLDDQTQDLLGALTASLDPILGAIKALEDDVGEILTIDIGQIEAVLEESQAAQTEQIGGIIDAAVAPIGDQLVGIGGTITSLSNTVNNANSGIADILGVLGGGLVQDIVNNITNTINIPTGIFNEVLDIVRGVVGDIVNSNGNVLVVLGGVIGDVLTGIGESISKVLGDQVEPLIEIKEAILHNKDENTTVLENVNNPGPDGIGGIIARSVLAQRLPDLDLSTEELRQGFVDFFQGPTGFECLTDDAMRDVMEGRPASGFIGLVVEGLSWIAAAGPLISGLAAAKAAPSIQDYMLCNPTFPLPAAESIIAFQRGLLDQSDLQDNIQRTGLGAEDAERLVNIGFTVPDLAILYNMFYRDLIDDDAFEQQLRNLGFTPGMLPALKELAFFVPPVQDLITMAVREVFSPAIAEANGQFEDFPPDFEEFAKQQGVSPEWAKNYWAAHWSLPSVQMGFEMLHRGVIDQDTLEELMRALDIMPAWRERLTQISFAPFTRVDIRRMHAFGVLSEDEVLRAYKDIGYDDEKAGKLKDFTLELNADEPILDLNVAEDLTRGSIVGFYKDGVIDRTIALALLVQAGINLIAAELFLDSADLDIERGERKADIDIVLDRFAVGTLTEAEAADRLRLLDLAPRELALALLELDRSAARNVKQPSRTELDKFLKFDLISESDYITELERIGYQAPWPDLFAKAVFAR